MSRLRRCAAIVVLAWLSFGIAAQARPIFARSASHDGAAAHASAPCHPAQDAGDRPASAPAPCQWPMPLLCCQDVAAVGAGHVAIAPPPALWLAPDSPLLVGPPGSPMRWAAIPPTLPAPSLRSSVVLQL